MKLPARIVKTWSDIQLNFDAIAAGSTLQTVKTFGPVAGNGAAITAGGTPVWVALPGFGLSYTTGAQAMRARIDVQARFDTGTAAWAYVYLGLNVVGGPVTERLRVDAPNATAYVNGQPLDLQWVHGGGPFGVHVQGYDVMTLAANRTYLFQPAVLSAAPAGTVTWGISVENTVTGDFKPR